MNVLERQRFRLHAAVASLLQGCRSEVRTTEFAGLVFRNPVGVAAGLDRHGRLLASIDALGFGFAEVGTLSEHADILPAVRRLARWRRKRRGEPPLRIGVSIGSLRPALDAGAADECARLARIFAPAADYLVFNLSRPRSPVRTGRFEPWQLETALQRVCAAVAEYPAGKPPLLLVKLAFPANCGEGYPAAIIRLFATCCDGLIAAFEGWPSVAAAADWLASRRPALPVIAVGGIRNHADVDRYLAAGATLTALHRAVRDGVFPKPRIAETG